MLRLERVYQYPFFMAAIFVSFILPQANSLVNNSSSSGFLSPSALEKVLLYSCMCAIMCWIGYQQFQPKEKLLSKLDIFLDDRKLLQAGFVLLSIGHLCNFLLSKITIERSAVNGNWTGPATILYFFSTFIFVALPIFLLHTLRHPNFINITMTVLAAAPILKVIIVDGRRQPTVTFLITVGMAFFLVKNYIPPRWLFIIFVGAAAFVIPVLGQLRGQFWSLLFSGDWQAAVDASQTNFEAVNTGKILELRNAALMMDAADLTNKYGFGTGFWDSIVFQYVPGQIVGFGTKKSLQFGASIDLKEIYGYKVPIGTTTTGIGDSYAELSYFGCLLFAAIGCIFKTLWISMTYRRSMFSSLLYIGLISPAMLGITHGISRFLQEFIFQAGTMYLVSKYAKISYNEEGILKIVVHNAGYL